MSGMMGLGLLEDTIMENTDLQKQHTKTCAALERYLTTNKANDLINLVRQAQFETIDYRRLLSNLMFDSDDTECYMQIASLTSIITDGYSYNFTDGITTISIPSIIPKTKGSILSVRFIIEPLELLLAINTNSIKRYDECTVFFNYCYNANSINVKRRIKDADNLEVSATMNVLERYLLTSDNLATLIQQTKTYDGPDCTNIYIIPGRICEIYTNQGAHLNEY